MIEPDKPQASQATNTELSTVYPILLTGLHHRLAIVVGGGLVGERKVAGLLAVRAQVRLISPQATPILQHWAQEGRIDWWPRPYQIGDVAGAFLVFAATNVREVNARVATEGTQTGALCNIADAPEEGNFHLPALHRQDDFVVAVGSQQGKNPKRVKQLRDRIAQWLSTVETGKK